MAPVRIGTRPSKLAARQAEMVSELLNDNGIQTEIVPISSTGDKNTSTPLFDIGTTGIFVEEVNQRVMDGSVDVAVHSAKDLPSRLPEGLTILGVLPRENPSDVLISKADLMSLPSGSVIGTSSIRRVHELKMARGDLKVENIRGNIDTRIKKFNEGAYDGIIVARAGLERLSLKIPFFPLNQDDFLPAPNQGIIAIVGLKDSVHADAVRKISHRDTFEVLEMERKLMVSLNLGCSLPAAILCTKGEITFRVRCRFYSKTGREFKEFTRNFTKIEELDSFADEIAAKVPASYGYNFQRM